VSNCRAATNGSPDGPRRARRLADEHPARAPVARAEHGPRARLQSAQRVQPATWPRAAPPEVGPRRAAGSSGHCHRRRDHRCPGSRRRSDRARIARPVRTRRRPVQRPPAAGARKHRRRGRRDRRAGAPGHRLPDLRRRAPVGGRRLRLLRVALAPAHSSGRGRVQREQAEQRLRRTRAHEDEPSARAAGMRTECAVREVLPLR